MYGEKRPTKAELVSRIQGAYEKARLLSGRATIEYYRPNGDYAVLYHHTEVIVAKKGGRRFILDSGGWRTPTTKDRINTVLNKYRTGFSVYQQNSLWYVYSSKHGQVCLFQDGMVLDKQRGFRKCDLKQTKGADAQLKKLKKQIDKFLEPLDTMQEIPLPDTGDCWMCHMETQDGRTLGEVSGDRDHIKSHIEEGYLHGSLIYRALQATGYGHYYQNGLIQWSGARDIIKRACRRYLLKQLGCAA